MVEIINAKTEKTVKTNENASSFADLYAEFENKLEEKHAETGVTEKALKIVNEVFEALGKDKLLFAALNKVVETKIERKTYNLLRSALKNNKHGYNLVEESGRLYVIKTS